MKFRASIVAALAFFFLSTAGTFAEEKVAASAEGKVAARVNGVPISEQQVDRQIESKLPSRIFHSNLSPEKRAEFRPQALEDLILRELFYAEALKSGYELPEAEMADTKKKLMARFKSDREFEEALKANGLTPETWEKEVRMNIIGQRFFKNEITDKAAVSDEEVSQYYENNKKEFLRPEALKVRHILIGVEPEALATEREGAKKLAEEVLAKARAGEDMATLAYQYSTDAWRVKEGDLGLIHRGRLEPELEDAAFKLEQGAISDVVETRHGFHIMKVEEKLPATQMGFEEVKERLRGQLETKKKKEVEENTVKRLKENAKIEIY